MQKTGFTREQNTLLHLAARNISENPSALVWSETELQDVDWAIVCEMSNRQAVTLAAFDAVTPYKTYIPKEIYERWKTSAMSVLSSDFAVEQSQMELIQLLRKGEYPYVILKGMAASAYYPNPELRALGDVDFLIDPTKQAEMEELLLQSGYKKSHGDHPNHVVFRKPKAHLEMHFEVSGVPYGWQGDEVRAFLKNTVFEPRVREQNGEEFYAPTDVMHGLILLLHM